MIRQPLAIPCEGDCLAATLDLPDTTSPHAPIEHATGLLIVSGGNEIRSGAWNGQARLAARVAQAGFPVLRFDRRGVGDSEGENTQFTGSTNDITAAIAAFRKACPGLTRLVAWGNCDAASALMLACGAGTDALILSNPWTFDSPANGEAAANHAPDPAEATPPQALRSYYLQRLANPVALAQLLLGKVSLIGLLRGLRGALRRAAPPTGLCAEMAIGLARFSGPVSILLAGRDRTAQTFRAVWNGRDPRLHHCPRASHSVVEPEAGEWLFGKIMAALKA